MIIATRIYTVNAENRDRAIVEMIKVSAASRRVPGITKHSFYADLSDSTAIRFYGEFENIEVFKRQRTSQHEVAFKKAMAAMGVTASPGTLSSYTPLTEYTVSEDILTITQGESNEQR